MARRFFFIAFLTGLTFLSLPGDASADSAPPVALKRIWETWGQRQDSYRSVRVKWKSTISLSGRTVRARADSDSKQQSASLAGSECSLTISGSRARYVSSIPSFSGGDQGESVPSISSFDGRVQQYFSDRSKRPQNQSVGTIGDYAAFDEWQNIHLLPLVYVLQPVRPEAFGSDRRIWRIVTTDASVDGIPCIVISGRDSTIPSHIQSEIIAHLDPQRGFVPLRIVHIVSGKTRVTLKMTYDRKREGLWVPKTWTSTMYSGDGQVSESSQNLLSGFEVNPRVTDGTFRIDFPPGTLVVDKRKNGKEFLVQNDGSLVPLQPGNPAKPWRWWLATLVSLAVLVISVFLALWWKTSRKEKTS